MGRHGRALMMEVSKPPDLREEPCLPRHPCLTAAVLDKPFPLSAAVSETPMNPRTVTASRSSFGTWGPSSLALRKTLFEMINAARPRSPLDPRAGLSGGTPDSAVPGSSCRVLSFVFVSYGFARRSVVAFATQRCLPAVELGRVGDSSGPSKGGRSTTRPHRVRA